MCVVKNEIRKKVKISLVKENIDRLLAVTKRWKYEISKDGISRKNYNEKKLCKTSKEERNYDIYWRWITNFSETRIYQIEITRNYS